MCWIRLEKKTLIVQEQDRPDVAEKRIHWRASQNEIDPEKFVFIDETWAKTNMTRTYGRSRQGTRLLQKVPFGPTADDDVSGRIAGVWIHRTTDDRWSDHGTIVSQLGGTASGSSPESQATSW